MCRRLRAFFLLFALAGFVLAGDSSQLLLAAVGQGQEQAVTNLLAAGANVNAVDAAGNSALMEAAAFGHLAIVSDLVLSGADVNLKNKAGMTALQRAKLGKRQPVLKVLQDAGASEEGGDE